MLKVHHVDVVGSEDRVKRDGRTDAADCTTFPANAFGNYFAPNREEKCCDERICVCVCVCVCVCLSAIISSELHVRSSTNFLCMLPMAVARSFSGGVVICYVLPVLWMTSRS